MSSLQELRTAYRRLRRRPVTAAGIVIALAIGLGICVSMFSVLRGAVLAELPYPNGERIVNLYAANPEQGVARARLTPAEALEGFTDIPGFERLSYYSSSLYTFTGFAGESVPPRMIYPARVSSEFFLVFGAVPEIGRPFTESDFAENQPVALLSYSAWLELTGGENDVIGRIMTFQNSPPLQVIGVLPSSFEYPASGLWVYQPWNEMAVPPGGYATSRVVGGVARLAPGASPELIESALQAHLRAVREANGQPDRGWQLRQTPLIEDLVGNVRVTMLFAFGVALLVLLIACATGGSLMSIRMRQRRAELALRRALGASGRRMVSDVAIELLILAGGAALGGMLLAYVVIEVVKPLAAGIVPRVELIGIERATLLFALGAMVVSLSLSGAIPLISAFHDRATEHLAMGANPAIEGSRRIALLPAAGVGFTVVAVIAALALSTSLVRLQATDPGLRTDGIASLSFQIANNGNLPSTVPEFLERVFAEIRAVPGVQDVTATAPVANLFVPGPRYEVQPTASETEAPISVYPRPATPGFHSFLQIPLVAGRDISEDDVMGATTVAVINETLAREAFGSTDPIGEVLRMRMGENRIPFRVVGVAADTRNAGLRAPPAPTMVIPIKQMPWNAVTVYVDSAAATVPANWLRTLQEAVWRVNSDQLILTSGMLTDEVAGQTKGVRFFAATMNKFAVLALLLSVIGVNAVVAAEQQRRMREIGLRLALGATPKKAAAHVLYNATRLVTLGNVTGVVIAIPAIYWLQSQGQLFGVDGIDLVGLFGLTVVVLGAAGLLAASWPAWRASRVAPMEVLRYE